MNCLGICKLSSQWLLKVPEFPLPGIFLATGFGGVCVRVHRFVKYCISCLDSDLRNHIIRQVTSPFPSFCHSWAMGVGALGCLFHTQIELLRKAFLPSPAPPSSVPALPHPLGLGMRLQVENCCKNIFRVCSLSRKPQRERWGWGEAEQEIFNEEWLQWELGEGLTGGCVEVGARRSWGGEERECTNSISLAL